MQSNRPGNFSRFLDRLETSVADPRSVEVIVKIDTGDDAMASLLAVERKKRPFIVKFIQTPLPDGFYGLWRSMNDMLAVCDPNAYFFLNLNDKMYIKTHGWDDVVRSYVGFFPDHIFRLRTSSQRYRNYFDYWECGFAPESAAFTSRRWIEIGRNWTPCNGPDTFQQFVAFYLQYGARFDQHRVIRDIPIAGVEIGGEGANVDLTGAKLRKRMRDSIPHWFTLVSHVTQEEAYRRAQKLAAHIWASESGIKEYEVRDLKTKKQIHLFDKENGETLKVFYYKLNKIRIEFTNLIRILNYGYYGGAGSKIGKNFPRNFLSYLCLRYESLDALREWYISRFRNR